MRGTTNMDDMKLEVIVRYDSDTRGKWAEVVQLPGCYGAGHSRKELLESTQVIPVA
jgi:predicted RNase H-like HicB family nuclease